MKDIAGGLIELIGIIILLIVFALTTATLTQGGAASESADDVSERVVEIATR